MMKYLAVIYPATCVALLMLAACAPAAKPKESPAAITGATAAASLTNAQGQNVGTVTFEENTGGVKVIVRLIRFQPGQYVTAVHLGGRCDAGSGTAFASAGDPLAGTTGSLESITVGPDGSEIVSTLNPWLTVKAGPNSVVGRTVLVKTATARVACGVVGSSQQ
jgi:Cu-Zn family superoxide dismutase